ncbi:MAG: GNAT family N-acetyltransferase [Oscillospiraceae bacterium]|nr:GNAT family N-acetyltransferase [Oscillospiraceae bacterium]
MRSDDKTMIYEPINESHLPELVEMYAEAFNAPPWNDNWTAETAAKRLRQMINCDGFMGLACYKDAVPSGMILGNIEHYFDSTHFHIKEFCVRQSLRGTGAGTQLLKEFETRLKTHGVGKIYLITSRTEETETFYLKKGYNGENNMVVMGKSL